MTEPKWYDVTIKQDEIPLEVLKEGLNKLKPDKYVIGDEIGMETGYKHWQIRVQFKKPTAMKKLILWNHDWGCTGHWSPTHEKNFDYCEKDGIYYRSWEGALAKYRDAALRPWQGSAIASLYDQSEREILSITDEIGNHGKSFLAKHLVVKYGYAYVPAMQNFEDFMFMAMAHQNAKGFIFDLPRADDITKKKQMWMAIETIKNGYLYDKRYNFRETWIEPPKILVFANDDPPFSSLSEDRWKAYYICEYDDMGCECEPWLKPIVKNYWNADIYNN